VPEESGKVPDNDGRVKKITTHCRWNTGMSFSNVTNEDQKFESSIANTPLNPFKIKTYRDFSLPQKAPFSAFLSLFYIVFVTPLLYGIGEENSTGGLL